MKREKIYEQLTLFDFMDDPVPEKTDDFAIGYDFGDRALYFESIATDERIFSVDSNCGKRFLCFQTEGTIILNGRGINDEKALLSGREEVTWPAMLVGFYDAKGKRIGNVHYSDEANEDDRQKWIIGRWHMEKVSHNRIYPGREANDFCEIGFSLKDYMDWLRKDIAGRDCTRQPEAK